MSTDNQVQKILTHSLNEFRWGDYSNMERVDVFEVWTIRADFEIDRVGTHIEYSEAVAAAQLLVMVIQAGLVSPIMRTVIVWIFRNNVEDSVLEVGIEHRKGNLVDEKAKRIRLIDDALDHCQKELIRLKMERDDGD